uniref:Uncharacterized protein n=1 Tax=Ciona savignyi TaxID=51511 RepID=H2YZK3_CIOSA
MERSEKSKSKSMSPIFNSSDLTLPRQRNSSFTSSSFQGSEDGFSIRA